MHCGPDYLRSILLAPGWLGKNICYFVLSLFPVVGLDGVPTLPVSQLKQQNLQSPRWRKELRYQQGNPIQLRILFNFHMQPFNAEKVGKYWQDLGVGWEEECLLLWSILLGMWCWCLRTPTLIWSILLPIIDPIYVTFVNLVTIFSFKSCYI